MLNVLDKVPLLGFALPFLLAALCLWGVVKAVRTGKVTAPYGTVIAQRSNDPLMFWIYVTATGGFAAFFIAVGLGLGGLAI